MYAPRVLGQDFSEAVGQLEKAVWKVSDIVSPRDPKTGFADARKLLRAVVAHAFRPRAEELKKGSTSSKNAVPARKKKGS
jgi:hypothetical protein